MLILCCCQLLTFVHGNVSIHGTVKLATLKSVALKSNTGQFEQSFNQCMPHNK